MFFPRTEIYIGGQRRTQGAAVTNCCVVALSLLSSNSLTWSADSLYSVQ